MRNGSEAPASRGAGRGSPALWVLAVVAALEAVVIGVLLVTRPAEQAAELGALRSRDPTARGAVDALPASRLDAPSTEMPIVRMESAIVPVAASLPTAIRLADGELGALAIMLCGSVTMTDGEPAEDANIKAIPDGEEDEDKWRWAYLDDGLFALPGMSPGPWRLECRAEGCQSQTIDLVLDAARPLERVDFVLPRAARVPVRLLTPEGRPLREALKDAQVGADVSIYATTEPLPSPVPDEVTRVGSATPIFLPTDPDPQVWDRMLVLSVPFPVHVSAVWQDRVLASTLVESETPGVTFTLAVERLAGDLGSARVRIVDAQTRAPLPGSLVRLGSEHTEVDAEGVAVFERMLPGTQMLHVNPPGTWVGAGGSLIFTGSRSGAEYGGASLEVELHPGERLDLGDIALERTIPVRGRVVDPEGKPVAIWVNATAVEPTDGIPETQYHRATETDPSDGSFTFQLVAGRWAFMAKDNSRVAPVVLRDVRAPLDGVSLVAGPATAVFFDFVSAGSDSASEYWEIQVKDQHDVEVNSTERYPEDTTPWKAQFAPGDYEVEVFAVDHEGEEELLSTLPFQVGSASLRVEVELP